MPPLIRVNVAGSVKLKGDVSWENSPLPLCEKLSLSPPFDVLEKVSRSTPGVSETVVAPCRFSGSPNQFMVMCDSNPASAQTPDPAVKAYQTGAWKSVSPTVTSMVRRAAVGHLKRRGIEKIRPVRRARRAEALR